MISLQQVGFSSLLPPNLQDTQTRALGAAWDKAFRKLVNYAEGNIVGKCAVLAEGDAADRHDIIFLEKLPLFFK